VIALKPVLRGRALEVVMFNPQEGDRKVHRVWPWFWRVAIATCAACLWFVYLAR
jgi:hypothetical protein